MEHSRCGSATDDGSSKVLGDTDGIFTSRSGFTPDDDPWLLSVCLSALH